MESAYVGESFDQKFVFNDERDPKRTPDSVIYKVMGPDKSLIDTGKMALVGNEGSFRLTLTEPGLHEIWAECKMGLDTWKYVFLLNVKESP